MAELSQKGRLKVNINGQASKALLEWKDINILATFDNDNTQANITIDNFTFANEDYQLISNYINAGLSGGKGVFEGLPIEIEAYNNSSSRNIFKGYLDLTDGLKVLSNPKKIKAKIRKANGLNTLEEKLESLSYGFLEHLGVFSQSDYSSVDYVVEKKINAFEVLTSAIILYLMAKELAEAIKNTADAIATVASEVAIYPAGGIGAIVYSIAIAAITIAYTAVLTVVVTKLGNQLIETFISLKRTHKVITLRKLLEKVALHLGYSFYSNISDLDTCYYLPSNLYVDEENLQGFIGITHGTKKGIPNASDIGYTCLEMFELAKKLFNAKFDVINNTLYFLNVDDDYWLKQSTYIIPNVLLVEKQYNTSELKANKILTFQTDGLADEWTIDNFKGTNYEVITDALQTTNLEAKYLKGLEKIDFGVCLGNRKDKLNVLEQTVKLVAQSIDDVVNAFGGSSHLADKVKGRIGLLKTSTNNITKPKILKLSGGKLAQNHRQTWSAKYIYQTYYTKKSFVQHNFYGQKEVYEGVRIPFGFNDFLKTVDNSYCYTSDGQIAKIRKLDTNIAGDFAIIDFEIRNPYTKNLQEIFIEAE